MNFKHKKIYLLLILFILTSCSEDHFTIVSEIIVNAEDKEKKIITLYENNYNPENIDWDKYENFASNISNNLNTHYEVYFFNKIDNTPKLDQEISSIDTSYFNSCIAKYTKSENEVFLKKYPYFIELGVHEMIMNADSTFTISFYAIRHKDVGGYQIELTPNNIFTFLSIEDEKISGEAGFIFHTGKSILISFSMFGSSLLASTTNQISDNILCTVKATCDNFNKLSKSRYYLDSVFADVNGDRIKIYNVPYTFKD